MGRRFPHVAVYVREMIARASTAASFHDVLLLLMSKQGRVLGPQNAAHWPTFVLDMCEALGGDPEAAIPAAAAVEFCAAAAEVIDDLVDDEWSDEILDHSRALNASAALLCLGQQCALRLAERLGVERACRAGDLIAKGYVAASAGEDLDLLLEDTTEVSEDLAHEMTRRKSGSLVAMACRVGAATAVDDPALVDLAGRFGCHLGVAAQIVNDLVGIDGDNPRRGSDLRRRKKTLPVAYALRCAQEEGNSAILGWYQGTPSLAVRTEDDVAAQIREIGGLHYGWVVADVHRREALSALRTLARAAGRPQVTRLRRLVPAMRPYAERGDVP